MQGFALKGHHWGKVVWQKLARRGREIFGEESVELDALKAAVVFLPCGSTFVCLV